jgi:hypothetical protein
MAEQLKTYSIIEKQNKQTKRKKEKNSQWSFWREIKCMSCNYMPNGVTQSQNSKSTGTYVCQNLLFCECGQQSSIRAVGAGIWHEHHTWQKILTHSEFHYWSSIYSLFFFNFFQDAGPAKFPLPPQASRVQTYWILGKYSHWDRRPLDPALRLTHPTSHLHIQTFSLLTRYEASFHCI